MEVMEGIEGGGGVGLMSESRDSSQSGHLPAPVRVAPQSSSRVIAIHSSFANTFTQKWQGSITGTASRASTSVSPSGGCRAAVDAVSTLISTNADLTTVLEVPLSTFLLATVGAICILTYAWSFARLFFSITVGRGMNVSAAALGAVSLPHPVPSLVRATPFLCRPAASTPQRTLTAAQKVQEHRRHDLGHRDWLHWWHWA